jgi:AraC family transcriptional activator of pobA
MFSTYQTPVRHEPTWESVLPVIEPQITHRGLHVWPFDPAFPVDVRFFVLNRDREIPLLRPDHLEVIYIESGEVVYQYRERECVLQKGDVVVVGNRVLHRCRKGGSSVQRGAVLFFLPEVIQYGAACQERLNYWAPFTLGDYASPKVFRESAGVSTRIFEMIRQISAELPRSTERSRHSIKTQLKKILLLLADHLRDERTTPAFTPSAQDSTESLQPVFSLVKNYYDSPLTVEEASEIAGLSRWQFMRLFKQATGRSFIGYLHEYRIRKAQELLVHTTRSIASIGLETGFCDQSYFGMVFRKYAHATPLAYRRQCEVTSH